ncbi:PBS lyase [Desulfolithobacter dissulfuricans]|uniref:PBS lyase n=1 Tax=Desulfolithobacter dissulfuricans TaxID=2795293 RepID=A0A915XJ80_9BACT|nr:DVU0298 family protein [Desulfolithobacter dissulfuricans]BCO10000.1 PBS lyase [Desulfolithobacter dissulfuricans]
MSSKESGETLKPWCPFCGMDVGRPTEAAQRKMTEFPVGRCDCGAIYVCDATGHNIGAAMVECLVYACNDEWDLAWELMPEDDYLTGRVEDYDDVTHQVVPKRNLDGRAVRGVLYFVRLHKEVAEIAERFREKQEALARQEGAAAKTVTPPAPEPRRDPKRRKMRASKQQVRELAAKEEIDVLVDLCLDDGRTLRFLQRLLYDPVEASRYHTAWIMGQVAARVSAREPGQVADLLHRLFEACADSAATPWGMIEAIGSIVAARPDIFGAFTRHLLGFMGDRSTQEAVIWSLGEIAAVRPDLIRKTPFYSTFHFLGHDSPTMRGLMARLLGRIKAKEAAFQVMGLQGDQTPITIYEQGRPVETTVGEQATRAVELINSD